MPASAAPAAAGAGVGQSSSRIHAAQRDVERARIVERRDRALAVGHLLHRDDAGERRELAALLGGGPRAVERVGDDPGVAADQLALEVFAVAGHQRHRDHHGGDADRGREQRGARGAVEEHAAAAAHVAPGQGGDQRAHALAVTRSRKREKSGTASRGPGAASGWYCTENTGRPSTARPSTVPSLRLTWVTWTARGQRVGIDREAVVLAGDRDRAGGEVLDRLVAAVVAELELAGLAAQREPEQLVAEADAEHRVVGGDQLGAPRRSSRVSGSGSPGPFDSTTPSTPRSRHHRGRRARRQHLERGARARAASAGCCS